MAEYRYEDEPDTAEQYLLRSCMGGIVTALAAAAVLEDKYAYRMLEHTKEYLDGDILRIRSRG